MSTKKSLLKKKKNSLKKKPQLKPGWYVLRQDKVKIDTDYIDPVYLFTYTLVNKAGVEFSFLERFVDDPRYERTVMFLEYLDSNGFEDVEDVIGHYEKVKIGWKFKDGKKYPSIAPDSRQFISEAEFNSREVLDNADPS